MLIGTVADHYELQEINVRGQMSPMEILTHEYEDIKDTLISEEEVVFIPNAPTRKTLQEAYNNIIQNAQNKLSKDKEFKNNIQELYKNVEEDYIKKGLNDIIKKKYNKEIISYIKEDLGYTDNEYDKNPNKINEIIISNLLSSLNSEEDLSDEEWLSSFSLSHLKNMNSIGGEMLNNWNVQNLNYLDYLPQKERKAAGDILKISSGIPYVYAFQNSGFGYRELSSTYSEQPIEQRQLLVQSGNNMISDLYKKLTQIAFDSGKMKVDEFVAIMGQGFCKKADCSDKLCVEYKLLCCWEHNFSPNC
jgi:hypothetical protein